MDAYDLGYIEGKQDGKEEAEEKYEDQYNTGWQDGFDTAAEQYGKEKDELNRKLAVKEQEIELLRKRLVSLSRQMEDLTEERNSAWHAGYDQAMADVMESESAKQES